jgi:hypothetical protein
MVKPIAPAVGRRIELQPREPISNEEPLFGWGIFLHLLTSPTRPAQRNGLASFATAIRLIFGGRSVSERNYAQSDCDRCPSNAPAQPQGVWPEGLTRVRARHVPNPSSSVPAEGLFDFRVRPLAEGCDP